MSRPTNPIPTPPDDPRVHTVDTSCACRRCTERTTAFYFLEGCCGNCGTRFKVKVRKGDRPGYFITCPACEVTGNWAMARLTDGD